MAYALIQLYKYSKFFELKILLCKSVKLEREKNAAAWQHAATIYRDACTHAIRFE